MKRTTTLRKKILARLERFELRICMAGDLYALPEEVIDVLDPMPVADFVDSPLVEQLEDFINHENDSSSHTDLVEFFPVIDGDLDFVDVFIDVWVDNLEPDDLPSDGQGQIDNDGELSNFLPDDVVGYLPIESEKSEDPNADPPSIPSADQRKDRLPPRRGEPVADDDSIENADLPVDSGWLAIKTPDPPPQDDTNPTPQPSSPSEDEDSRLNFSPGHQESTKHSANRAVQERNPVVGVTSLENRSASSHHNLAVGLPSADRGMQRFSSTDIAFTTINQKATDPSFTADALALRSFAISRQSLEDSPKYFARHQEFRSRVATLRESYSDPSVRHETEDIARVISDQVAGDLMIKNAYGTGVAERSMYPVAAVLTGLVLSAESESIPEPDQRAANKFSSDGIVQAKMKLQASEPEPEPESPSPSEHRSLQRFLGLIMAGALIAIQESSRPLQNYCDRKNSLHRKRISALKNSSNS